MLGASQGYIGASLIFEEANIPLGVASDGREYHVLLLVALPAVNRAHVVLQVQPRETFLQLLHLP